MGRYILKIHDHYLEWSTVVDARVTSGMSLDEFTAYYQNEYGRSEMHQLPARIARADATGTSALDGKSLEKLVSYNKAGPRGSKLTLAEIYTAYCLDQPIRDGWKVPWDDDTESV